MTHTFTAHFTIRQYELNSHEDLPNSTLARLFQETAMLASADAGYGVEWYSKHQSVWLIHDLSIERARPVHYLDELAITTWVSDFKRVLSHREYLACNAKTNEFVARGRAYWVHLNRETLMPAKIPVDILSEFTPNGITALRRIKPRSYTLPAHVAPCEWQGTRHVQRYEADGFKHVNNAVYIDWLEEALADASLMHPSTTLRSAQDASQLCVYRHDVEYQRSALPGDYVTIDVKLIGVGQTASEWNLEIKRDKELLVRDQIIALWVNKNGKPIKW